MFTGIIEDLGEVRSVSISSSKSCIQIFAPKMVESFRVGDSVAVNGVCLTVIRCEGGSFFADVMPETFRKTNLCEARAGEKVNLERALRASDRLGGHFVLGHVDQVGVILDKKEEDNSILFWISLPEEIKSYLVPKGSIAVDGISLTIVELHKDSFAVSAIRHTARITTLGQKTRNSRVNLEADIIGKYVGKCVENKEGTSKNSSSTLALLCKFGYLEKGGAE